MLQPMSSLRAARRESPPKGLPFPMQRISLDPLTPMHDLHSDSGRPRTRRTRLRKPKPRKPFQEVGYNSGRSMNSCIHSTFSIALMRSAVTRSCAETIPPVCRTTSPSIATCLSHNQGETSALGAGNPWRSALSSATRSSDISGAPGGALCRDASTQ